MTELMTSGTKHASNNFEYFGAGLLWTAGGPTNYDNAIQAGQAGILKVHVDDWGTATDIKFAIYEDNSLVEEVEVSSSEGTGELTIPIDVAISDTADYKVCIHNNSQTVTLRLTPDAGKSAYYQNGVTYGSLPTTLNASNFYQVDTEFWYSIEDSPAPSFAIDSVPASITSGTQASLQVSNPATAPTTGNTQVRFTGGSGPAATVDSVTGTGPYTINFTFPTSTAAQFDATGYPLYVVVDAENDTSAAVPYNEPAGQDYTDLSNASNPIVARPLWVSGQDYGVAYGNGNSVAQGDVITNAGESYYCNEAGTLGATAPTHTGGTTNSTSGVSLTHIEYLSGSNIAEVLNASDGYIYGRTTSAANSTTTPADGVDGWTQLELASSALDGFTGESPITGDQIVYENPTPENSIGTVVDATGVWTLDTPPPSNQTMDWYIIQADGTVGTTGTATYVAAVDTTPDAFSFTAQTDVQVNSPIVSNSITVSGITSPAPISVTGGEYARNTGGGFGSYTSTPSNVDNGDQIRVRLTSSSSFSTLVTATLTIGGVSADFDVTTLAQDTTPNQFTFAAQTDVAINTTIQSNTITVGGINSAAPISISSTEAAMYSVNGGAQTSVAGTVNNGDTVTVYLPSSASYSAQTSATLTIGGVLGTFNVTTLADPGVPVTPTDIVFADAEYAAKEFLDVGDVVVTLVATGGDATLVYSMVSGNDDKYFSLSSAGILTLAKAFDYSKVKRYHLVIDATDGTTTERAHIIIHVIEKAITVKTVDILRDALEELIVQASEQPLKGSDTSKAIRTLNRMIRSWPFEIGYIPVDSTSDDICIPEYAELAIMLNLAILLAPQFDMDAPQLLRTNANNAYNDLLTRKTKLKTAQTPTGVPLGSGNKYPGYRGSNIFIESDD